jgi:cysteinyl-tRNA synthetase
LNLPQAVAVLHGLLKSDVADGVKSATLKKFDEVLGLNLRVGASDEEWPREITELLERRETARKNKDWDESDELRVELEQLGYSVEDGAEGTRLRKL